MTQGKRIRAIRQLRGYSQKELGIRAGMSPKSAGSRIARYEDGRCVPRKETLFRIARALNVSPMAVAPYTGRDPREILEILFWLEEAGKMDGIMEVRDLMAMMDVWEAKKERTSARRTLLPAGGLSAGHSTKRKEKAGFMEDADR